MCTYLIPNNTILKYVSDKILHNIIPTYLDSIFITGGSIQRAIHRQEGAGDIDIFICHNDMAYTKIVNQIAKIFNSIAVLNEKSVKYHRPYYEINIDVKLKYKNIRKKLQIFQGVVSVNLFDIECCKAILPVKKMHIEADSRIISEIVGLQTKVNWKYATDKTKKRILKYMMQGYQFPKEDLSKLKHDIKHKISWNKHDHQTQK